MVIMWLNYIHQVEKKEKAGCVYGVLQSSIPKKLVDLVNPLVLVSYGIV